MWRLQSAHADLDYAKSSNSHFSLPAAGALSSVPAESQRARACFGLCVSQRYKIQQTHSKDSASRAEGFVMMMMMMMEHFRKWIPHLFFRTTF